MASSPILFSTLMLLGLLLVNGNPSDQLSTNYYGISCPSLVFTVNSVLQSFLLIDRSIAAAVLRLNFHDCFIRGCDASVTLVSNSSNIAERDGIPNKNSLRGFNVIDAVKAAVEAICPNTVSCADIIALSAREAIFIISGVYWNLPFGRRDGTVSLANETLLNLPSPFLNYTGLVSNFASKGLSEQDMVVLSLGHTIGFAHCGAFQRRLYNSTAPGNIGGTDPTLDPTLAASLKLQCPLVGGSANTLVAMDPTGVFPNNTFDNTYYTRVQSKQGLLITDAALMTVTSGEDFVAQEVFNYLIDFPAAMIKMNAISPLVGTQGEIRKNCSVVNHPS